MPILDELQISESTKIVIKRENLDGTKVIDIRKKVDTEDYSGYTKKGIAVKIEHFPELLEKLNKVEIQ